MMQPTQRLWPGDAPGAVGSEPEDIPTLTPFIPDKPNGSAILVCPGGGYGAVVDHEKNNVAEWLNTLGITAFTLVYRVGPRYRHPVMLQDVSRAMRTIRAGASQWKIDPKRIGVIGFSAGGHLASIASVFFDAGDAKSADPIERVSSRPDVSVLVYPVITMLGHGHTGSRTNLLGETPSQELMELLSTERQIKKDTPPTFIYHRTFDATVRSENPLLYALGLASAGVPYELHVYDHKGHGQVFAKDDPIDGDWTVRLTNWLRRKGF